MKVKELYKKHPNKLLVLTPLLRHAENNFVVSWQVLNTATNIPDLEKSLEYYEKEEYNEVVAFSTFDAEEFEQVPELTPAQHAKFYRVMFNIDK